MDFLTQPWLTLCAIYKVLLLPSLEDVITFTYQQRLDHKLIPA